MISNTEIRGDGALYDCETGDRVRLRTTSDLAQCLWLAQSQIESFLTRAFLDQQLGSLKVADKSTRSIHFTRWGSLVHPRQEVAEAISRIHDNVIVRKIDDYDVLEDMATIAVWVRLTLLKQQVEQGAVNSEPIAKFLLKGVWEDWAKGDRGMTRDAIFDETDPKTLRLKVQIPISIVERMTSIFSLATSIAADINFGFGDYIRLIESGDFLSFALEIRPAILSHTARAECESFSEMNLEAGERNANFSIAFRGVRYRCFRTTLGTQYIPIYSFYCKQVPEPHSYTTFELISPTSTFDSRSEIDRNV